MKTLIIVDMQKWFFQHGNYQSVINSCQQLVKSAINNKSYIIYLRYAGCGKVISDLLNLTARYKKCEILTKNIEDGSSWVAEYLNSNKINPTTITVGGVQTDMCVYNTVEGLSTIYPKSKIEVSKKACGALYNFAHNSALQNMKKLFSNVSII